LLKLKQIVSAVNQQQKGAPWRRGGVAVDRFAFMQAGVPVPAFVGVLALLLLAGSCAWGQSGGVTDQTFEQSTRPLLKQYCFQCHSTEKHKGDIDLERFTSLAEVLHHPEPWEHVLEELSLGEMPPKEKPQPTTAERERLRTWVDEALEKAAQTRAGDPGPVLLRRLNNAEYTYTVRDLTGVESLDPAAEFPADSAAGEGFMNTGSTLVMSPPLVTKYLDAGKLIASHAVLLPDGIRFSAKTTRRDWTDESLAGIRAFYDSFTDAGGKDIVTQQGIALDRTKGGSLPLKKYLTAALELRDTTKSAAAVARERGLSVKYLGLLVRFLQGDQPLPLLDGLRARWRLAKESDLPALVAEITEWQGALWKFNSVGHIGMATGPTNWMEPVSPLVGQQELRVKLSAPTNGNDIVVYLTAGNAGDGPAGDFVVWQQPRLVPTGRPPVLLRDVRSTNAQWGLDPALFGKRADGGEMEPASLCVQAPSVIEVRLPASLAAGGEFVTTAMLDANSGPEGSVQLQVLTNKPGSPMASLLSSVPVVVNKNSAARQRFETAFAEFRQIFPASLCYTKIVPVDEVVTLTLFYREDEPLMKLMLNDDQKARLDQMWDELHFVSQDALTLVDAFEQLWQFSTQDGPDAPHGDKRLEPMREPINRRAAAFKQRLMETQPRHLQAVLAFAESAYRRPLSEEEKDELRGLYQRLRQEDLPHDEAIRLLLARIFVAPAFLYRLENAPAGVKPGPISDWELANRLSYFLWSSAPDAELRALAAKGELHQPDLLAAQTRRMLRDARVRRLATEFACQWLHIHDFQSLDEKSERHFPTFAGLRGPMFEEAVRFFTDSFQNNDSILTLFDTDHTFLNESLARHYGIPDVQGAEWRRVDGVRKYGRGGILGLSATLAKESGASRTSPILRGDWVSEVLLGERIPRPPKDVPRLPEDEATETLTVRQLTEKHISDPRCAGCHARFDGFGYALEGYDAIGCRRTNDLGGRTIDTRAVLFDGTTVNGADDLRHYLLTERRDALLQQFCRKLLGYALGRSVILSDRPLLAEMRKQLDQNDDRFFAAVETIVRSKQFLEIRGQDAMLEE
jgi:uncharacterized protein YbjT (DUF2867 family)